ncbi:MAG: hypothetical protein FWG89_10340 [Treponema sp.]|nr:hypothetical protein [Treponema sp.]
MNRYRNITAALCAIIIFSSCFLGGCGELDSDPAVVPLVSLLPGSPGYAWHSAVRGLLNGEYLVMHQKKETWQEKDPAGKMQIFHKEDWYAVRADRSVYFIASSTGGIPAAVNTVSLSDGEDVFFPALPSTTFHEEYYTNRYDIYAVNIILGLVNGETYGVYRYGELNNGQRVGRGIGHLQTYNVNTVVNIKDLTVGEYIYLIDRVDINPTVQPSGPFNDNNHLVVLVDTSLYWTEIPLTLNEDASMGAAIRLIGYDFDIIIEKVSDSLGWVSVDAIKQEGQKHFILSGSPAFEGRIIIAGKN